MPDITMCMKQDCPRRNACYRVTAKPDRWQAYAVFGECNEDNDYELFMDAETGKVFGDW